MTTTNLDISRLQELADELTKVSPPPKDPKGINHQLRKGHWVIAKAGAGMYVVRAAYVNAQDEIEVIKTENEMSGFANSLAMALRFAIQVASSTRHYWLPA